MKSKGAALLAIVGTIFLTAAVSIVTTTLAVSRVGGYTTSSVAWDSATGAAVGGDARYYISADSEKVGSVVYLSGANAVSKSATLANYNAVAGVVVGGAKTNMLTDVGRADVGTLAAIANQRVWVVKCGRVWVVSDSAAAVGTIVIPSVATAGRVHAKPALIDTNYRALGRVVTAVGGTDSTVLLNLCVK